jgi:transposase-like protein
MAKYSKKIVDSICKLIKSDSYTIAEVCSQVGINQDTYFVWKREKPEFSEAVKKAEDERRAFFALEAKKSLLKKIQGYEVDETKTVYVDDKKEGLSKPKIKEKTITKKYIQPDTAAIIFTLTNCDSENWKNRQSNEVKIADSVEVTLDI